MSSTSAYAAFAALLESSGYTVPPAELHGLLVGRSCAGLGFEPEGWLEDARELLGSELPEPIRQALLGLQEMVKGELSGDELSLVLLLPDDETPLAERAGALGQWCQGFLSGFGMAPLAADLPADAMEVLHDLAAIAQVQSALEESEVGESDYMEVMEYVRLAPLLLMFAVRGVPADQKPSLH